MGLGHYCCRNQKVKRGLWSPEEDEKLINYIITHGKPQWSSLPKLAGLERCGKSCRLRWINYLRPDLKKGSFSEEEERIVRNQHRMLGNKWAKIAKHLPGRTDNDVKNFWNTCIKKKIIEDEEEKEEQEENVDHLNNYNWPDLSQFICPQYDSMKNNWAGLVPPPSLQIPPSSSSSSSSLSAVHQQGGGKEKALVNVEINEEMITEEMEINNDCSTFDHEIMDDWWNDV